MDQVAGRLDRRATVPMNVTVGPFDVAPGGDDTVVGIVGRLLTYRWPWHTMLAGPRGRIRIQVQDNATGGRYWPGQGIVVVGPPGRHTMPWLIAHEVGHAIDQVVLTDADRAKVREAMGAPDDQPWLISGDLQHHQATGESFAEWCAYEWDATYRTMWGVHRWSDSKVRDRLRTVTFQAARRVRVFDDVDPDSTHAEAIHALAAAGIIGGRGDGTFRPDAAVTRGQLATILYNAGIGRDSHA